MSNLAVIHQLYDYHFWATRHLLETAAQVSAADYYAPNEFSEGGLHRVLFHNYDTDWAWGLGCRTGKIPPAPPTPFPTLESLWVGWQEEERTMRAFLATLNDAALQKEMTFHEEPDGRTFTHPLYVILLHIVLHAGQHRAEIAALLTRYGASPGDMDLTRMLEG